MKRLVVVVVFAFATSTLSTSANAGGLYFADRGVRPLARGGAFVAGADDLNAMWYNPAGLADAQGTLLADAAVMLYGADFTRTTRVLGDGGGFYTYQFATVHGDVPPLAIPTLGIASPAGRDHRWTVGGGVYAPYAPLLRWPETTADGSPSPSRYSLVSLEGSALAVIEAFATRKFSDHLQIGAGLQLLAGVFQSTVDLGAVPPGILAAAEDPSYDALTEVRATIFTPSANAGVTWIPNKFVRVGLAGQLPFWVDAPATVRVRLPNAAVFDSASQNGEDAGVKFRLPAILRAGIELRPSDAARIELSYEHQFWSLHDTIDITPHGVQLVGVTAFPSPYNIPPISLQRHFQDSDSVHLGGEYRIVVSPRVKVDLRAGFAFETSAIPTAYESPLTVDGNKFEFAGGLGVTYDRTRLDATFGYVYMPDVDVSPAEAQLGVVNPVSGYPPPPGPVNDPVNAGHYSAGAPIIGLGFQYTFGSSAPPPPPKHEPRPAPPPPPPPPPPTAAPEVPVEEAPPPKPKHKKKKHKKHTAPPRE